MFRTTSTRVALLAVFVTAGGLFAWQDGGAQRYLQTPERHTSSLSYFGANQYLGSVMISHGQPVWKDAYNEQVLHADKVADGTRFRLGNNSWATLESTAELTIGGVTVPAGYYYLAFEKAGDGVAVVAFDAAEMRAKLLPSWAPPQEGGIRIPLKMTETDDTEDELTADFLVDNRTGATDLEILWGPYQLVASVEVGI